MKMTVTEEYIPEVVVSKIHADDLRTQMENEGKGEGKGKGKEKERPTEEPEVIKPARTERTLKYEGPIRRIETTVKWQNPERGSYCEHIQKPPILKADVSPTVKVRVADKLSVQYDRHLGNEARNYEKFPSHFFEHWNGFNVMRPLRDPVPVGAVVPQFYGCYVPKNETSQDTDGGHSRSYLSPILLLENCGTPVQPEDLNRDDRQECASLYYRFHHEGWSRGSVYPRNILVQRGPLHESPLFHTVSRLRGDKPELSFRLIDSGRSIQDTRAMLVEEMAVDETFYVFRPLPGY
jgi:hypothetical protein